MRNTLPVTMDEVALIPDSDQVSPSQSRRWRGTWQNAGSANLHTLLT
jgi:hypothetical protein